MPIDGWMSSSTSILLLLTSPLRIAAFVSVSTFLRDDLMLLRAAKNAEEDLEMTRQIILRHVRNVGGDMSDYLIPEKQKHDREPPSPTKTTTATTTITNLVNENYDYASANALPFNDLIIRAALGHEVERTPVWLFRQAGRHLPEYNAYKTSTGKNFLELLMDPVCVAECTLQPVRRYYVDAAILFSDILVIPEALGMKITMPGGVGIQVPHPFSERSDLELLPPLNELDHCFVEDKLSHVLEAIRQIKSQLTLEKIYIPLIGFSAAPWTLLYYMVGGSSKKNSEKGMWWLKTYPVASQALLDKLTTLVIEYLSAQVRNGCHLLQLFEAMSMKIDDANFIKYALPSIEKIGRELKRRHPEVPLMVFCRGACHLNDRIAALGCYDVITIDGSVDRKKARAFLGINNVSLQGNYDPAELISQNGKTADTVRTSARRMLQELGPTRLIANLGEGLGGKESPELVDAFVEAIHDESAKMIRASRMERAASLELER